MDVVRDEEQSFYQMKFDLAKAKRPDASVKKNLSYFHLFLSYPQNKRNKM